MERGQVNGHVGGPTRVIDMVERHANTLSAGGLLIGQSGGPGLDMEQTFVH